MLLLLAHQLLILCLNWAPVGRRLAAAACLAAVVLVMVAASAALRAGGRHGGGSQDFLEHRLLLPPGFVATRYSPEVGPEPPAAPQQRPNSLRSASLIAADFVSERGPTPSAQRDGAFSFKYVCSQG